MFSFENIVKRRTKSLGVLYQRQGELLPLFLMTFANYEMRRSLLPTADKHLLGCLVDLGAAATLLAVMGDTRFPYKVRGSFHQFYSTLPDELRLTLPYLQLAQRAAEVHYMMFLPNLTFGVWDRLQEVFLLCEYLHVEYSTPKKERQDAS